MACTWWPLFDLELRTPRLCLRTLADDHFAGLMDAIDAGIHDPETMPFSHPWTDAEPGERRRNAAKLWWRTRAGWSHDEWMLPFAVLYDGRPIGVQELFAREFPTVREVGTGSWLTKSMQGQGIGREMRTAVLALAFDGLGALAAHSEAFADNAASNGVSLALGYRENGRRHQAPRGDRREMVNYVLTAECWQKRKQSLPPVRISGLEACAEMFGA